MQNDEFHGQGGSYIIRDGKRELVERTGAEAPQQEPNPGEPLVEPEPNAGALLVVEPEPKPNRSRKE